MSNTDRLAYAVGAEKRINDRLHEDPDVNLDALITELPDGGTREELRAAVAYLAAQAWAERNATDAARAHDSTHALAMIERQIDWWRSREQARRTPSGVQQQSA